MQTQSKDYWRLFKPSACTLGLKATTQEGVFEEIAAVMVKAKLLPADRQRDAVDAFLAREALASTGIGGNVAVPHAKLAGIEEPCFTLSLAPQGLEWNADDGEPARIFFGVLRPERAGKRFDPERHLEMMRWISQLTREPDFRRFALAVGTRKELVDLLKEMSGA